MDFTLKTYYTLLATLQNQGYAFQPLADFLQRPRERVVVLRHDVEKRYENALQFASMQHKLGIRGSYYFRILNGQFQREIIARVADMGHEIGYHYDDLSHCRGDHAQAIRRFERHLAMLREISPVQTICMEGAPLSNHDNRDLWKHYNYRDYGIIGEPYFEVDFSKVLYLTDTGRRWDGDRFSIRDRVSTSPRRTEPPVRAKNLSPPRTAHTGEIRFAPTRYQSTHQIITAANNGSLPNQILFTFHPQRWTSKPMPWLQELVWQNVKNVVKAYRVRKQKKRMKK